MNTKLLRLARRDSRGVRAWLVPGFGNAIVLRPSSLRHIWPGAATLSWPCDPDGRGEGIRTVRLDWHWKLAKAEMRRLLDGLKAARREERRARRIVRKGAVPAAERLTNPL